MKAPVREKDQERSGGTVGQYIDIHAMHHMRGEVGEERGGMGEEEGCCGGGEGG